jgi:hypothetical protein
VNRYLTAALAAVVLALAIPGTAQATEGTAIDACVPGWYVNPDETDNKPEATEAGLKFEGKDLAHHEHRPLDLADVRAGSFVADGDAGKLFMKLETTAPYSTIVVTGEGTFWSTAMTYDQEGGQGKPVAKVSDLVGKPTKPGKPALTADTKVVTFGVGYATEAGSTVVSSIRFHGTTYDVTCKPEPTPTPTVSASPSVSPSPSTSASVSPSATASVTATPTGSASASPTTVPGNAGGEPGLPVTGPALKVGVGVGLILLATGAVFVFFSRRRRNRFEA